MELFKDRLKEEVGGKISYIYDRAHELSSAIEENMALSDEASTYYTKTLSDIMNVLSEAEKEILHS